MALQPPPGIDLSANNDSHIVSAVVALLFIPTVFVFLRLLSRRVSRAGFWWDDVLVVVSLILTYTSLVSILISVKIANFGRHIWASEQTGNEAKFFFRFVYVNVVLYYIAVVSVKFGILTFYRRIFPRQEIGWWLLLGYTVVGIYGILMVLISLFRCGPINASWDKSVEPKVCLDSDKTLVVGGSVNCVLDAAILGIPIVLVRRLRTTKQQKWVLTAIFACTGFVCIIAIIRLGILARINSAADDPSWTLVPVAIWSAAEPAMGVIAACLPSLRPLLAVALNRNYIEPNMSVGTSRSRHPALCVEGSEDSMQSMSSTWGTRLGPGKEKMAEFNMYPVFSSVKQIPGQHMGHNNDIQGGIHLRSADSTGDISPAPLTGEHGGILVTDEVIITHQDWTYENKIF